jgi:hypothetical protein
MWSRKKYTVVGQKGENKPSNPKNGIWAKKSIGSYMEQENIL